MVNKSPEQIKQMIYRRGGSLTFIDRKYGLAKGASSHALYRPEVQAETAIASFLKVTPQQLWPERWDESGKRRQVRHIRNTLYPRLAHSRRRAA